VLTISHQRARAADHLSRKACLARINQETTMGMGSKIGLLSGFVAAAVAASGASAANLVTNGSFETPVIGAPFHSTLIPTGWTKGGSAGDASIWRVGYSDSGGTVSVAGEGMQFVTMGGGFSGTGSTTWSQALAGLTIGGVYQLDFKIAAEGACCGAQSVLVDFVGSSTGAQSFTAPSPAANYWKDWLEQGMTFVAAASDVTLRFTYTGRYDMGLDDIRVTPVPEPATTALWAAGLAMLGVVVRRRGSAAI
jgi:hypothetical protein